MFKRNHGFTLIELLVVIAIIGILATLVIIRIGGASDDAKDSRRKSDLNQIRTAIEQAKNTGTTVNTTGCAGYPCNRNLADTSFTYTSPQKAPSEYLAKNAYPTDPNGGSYTLRLTSATAPSTNYLLVATDSKGVEIIVGG